MGYHFKLCYTPIRVSSVAQLPYIEFTLMEMSRKYVMRPRIYAVRASSSKTDKHKEAREFNSVSTTNPSCWLRMRGIKFLHLFYLSSTNSQSI
jgi:hypothetical protein